MTSVHNNFRCHDFSGRAERAIRHSGALKQAVTMLERYMLEEYGVPYKLKHPELAPAVFGIGPGVRLCD